MFNAATVAISKTARQIGALKSDQDAMTKLSAQKGQ